jgi:hypothetical protein
MRKPRLVGAPIVVLGLALLGIMGLLTMGLWNLFMPAILRLPAIDFGQALALFVLCRLLFGRLPGGRSLRHSRFVRGWKDLTPEERERFRRAMRPHPPESLSENQAPPPL